MARILVGLSGGVDSSVAAALLLRQGNEVVGAYMKNWINEENITGHCPWQQDIDDARAVAEVLGIEFRVVNLMRDYRERVVNYLLQGYEDGITPNPDVMCNREMKFGVFLDYALHEGFEQVATGHYARGRTNADGTREILRGVDFSKDQTYFLALLQQPQVMRAIFPVGELLKKEVREAAHDFGLPTASKKDSQGICFIGEVKMSDFLKHYVPDAPGDIVTVDGKVVGQHAGLHLYTLGQRKGIRIPSNTHGKAFVVVEKRRETRELVVGFDLPDTPGLYASACEVAHVTRINQPFPGELQAAPRYRCAAVPVRFEANDSGATHGRVLWDQPQRALTPGQICAFYQDEVLLGGGTFTKILSNPTD